MKTKYQNQRANFDAADQIAAPAATALMEDGDDEGLDVLDEYADIFRATIAQIDTDEDAGVLDPEEAEELRIEAVEDYEDLIYDLLGIDPDMEDDMADYAAGSELATFRAANSFGEALQQLAMDEFENPDDAIYAIAEHTGYEPEHILGLITGEYVPDDDLASEIAEVFETTANDEDAYNGLLALGQEVREQEQLDEEDDEGDEEDVDEETENFSRYLADKDRRIAELEAQFSEASTQHYVSEQLMELEQQANYGVQEGWFPPVAYREMFASFRSDKDKLAAFSSVCHGNQVDMETELYAMQKVLSLFERCGPQIKFGAIVEEPLTQAELDQEEAVLAQAARNVQLRRQKKVVSRKSEVVSERQ